MIMIYSHLLKGVIVPEVSCNHAQKISNIDIGRVLLLLLLQSAGHTGPMLTVTKLYLDWRFWQESHRPAPGSAQAHCLSRGIFWDCQGYGAFRVSLFIGRLRRTDNSKDGGETLIFVVVRCLPMHCQDEVRFLVVSWTLEISTSVLSLRSAPQL